MKPILSIANVLAVMLALSGAALAQGGAQGWAQDCTTADLSIPGEILVSGWTRSYHSGCVDATGQVAGGSEILHLVGHKGMLFAAAGYWEDPRNPWYGGTDPNAGWGQILRLDSPSASWRVDLNMTQCLRPEILKSVTFTTDGNGQPLDQPVNLLLTSTYELNGSQGIDLFTRDDDTGQWVRTKVISGDTGFSGEADSVRAMFVHNDAVTGVDRLFLSIGQVGVYSGVYDPAVPGQIRWDGAPEVGPLDTRPLAMIEANGSLYFSAGAIIDGRVDGPSPAWVNVADLTGLVPASDLAKSPAGTTELSETGGIRGLSPLPNPNGDGQSMIFMWAPGNDSANGCIMRLDPDGSGGYTRVQETCLDTLVTKYLLGTAVPYMLGAYNNILPVANPAAGDTNYLIGLEEVIVSKYFPLAQPTAAGTGFYSGGLYAVRDSSGAYRIAEVNGRMPASNRPFVSVRSYVVSPFPDDNGQVLYFGGYDCDNVISSDTAWIFKTGIGTGLLEPPAAPTALTRSKK